MLFISIIIYYLFVCFLNVVHYLAPRGSYLTAIAGPVRDHFLVSAPAVVDEMWFDHNGIPLKWYLPCTFSIFTFFTLHLVPGTFTFSSSCARLLLGTTRSGCCST